MSIISMNERVEMERGSRKVSEIKELNLDNSKATEIEGLTDQFENLEQLSLVNVGLQSLAALPVLPALKKIDLADNRVSSALEPLSHCIKLEQINLSGNEIKSVDTLAPFKELKHLRGLDLNNCPVTEGENYRKEVFELIPHLKYLDGFDQNNLEEPAEEDLVNGDSADANKDTEAVTKTGEAAEGDDDEEDDYYDEEEEDEDDEDVDDEEDDEEEIDDSHQLAALRGEADLEDDEEDYEPPEGAEDEDDDFVDEEDEDAILEAEAADESGVANLSAAGVTGARRPGAVKRRQSDAPNENGNGSVEEADEPSAKKAAVEGADSEAAPAESNGAEA